MNNKKNNHKIIISKNAGYCMGVKRAFAGSFAISEKSNNICIYGEMVHNRFALQVLSERGIEQKEKIEDIINNSNIKNVIIRAHGIPPEEESILKKSKKNIIDFTCPKVKQVQLLAQRLSNEGNTIILFGKSKHPEVIGILGYCKKPYYVIKNLNEAKELQLDKIKNTALISQTTMNSIIFEEICNYLKSKIKTIKIYNTLCNSPIKIQESAFKLANNVDAMLVVGDKSSANTTTLYEKIKDIIPTWFIETGKDLPIEELKKYHKIGITGGSSTPQWQMEKIKEYILEIK